MTLNEAIEMLNNIQVDTRDLKHALKCSDLIETAVKALEEVQEYRKLGTLEELARVKKYIDLTKKHGTIGEMIDECAEYESIGTVEECREAVEKHRPKKPRNIEYDYSYFVCPNCGEGIYVFEDFENHKFCLNCGQAIQWDDNLEGMDNET